MIFYKKYLWLISGVFFLLGMGIPSGQSFVADPGDAAIITDPKPANRVKTIAVDSLLQTLTLEEKIGQLFVVPAYGRFSNTKDDSYRMLLHHVERLHIGGIIFMQGDILGQAALTNKIQLSARIPLWITQDMEFGAAMRISGATRFTPAMGIAASGDTRNAFLAGKVTALEAKALGVHQIFGPVLDVNNNPENPVINVRSFSSNPQVVSDFGIAFMRGVESEGIVATAKHFPGHGDTHTDSHLELPIVEHNYARLDSLELFPFKNAIRNGLSSVMSAHIAYPNVSPDGETPSTLDVFILKDILRDSLNFNGVVITDGLEMRGISSKFSPGRAVVKALNAGADLMLISPDVETAIYEVMAAVKTGELTIERINQSVRKLLVWKSSNGLFDRKTIDLNRLPSQIDTKDFEVIADKIARESVTLLKNKGDILPIQVSKYPKVYVLSVADDETGSTGTSLARYIRDFHPDVSSGVFDRRSGSEEQQKIIQAASKANLIIVGTFISTRTGSSSQLTSSQLSFLSRIERLKKPMVEIAFGNPYVLKDLDSYDVHILSWSGAQQQVKNTVPALFGASEVKARLPIDIPGMYSFGSGISLPQTALRLDNPESVGMNADSLFAIDRIMQKAIIDSVFPGGVVAVIKDGVLAYQKAFGYHDYEKIRSVQPTDVYDLASLTKVLATTAAVMHLFDRGKLNINAHVSDYIPEFKTKEKKDITITDLLLHQSGLPAFKEYIREHKTRGAIISAIKNEPLEYEPRTKYVYSDLGMILLAEIVASVSGKRLDSYVRENFYYPMGMYSSFFNPQKVGKWLSGRVPPTEIDTVYNRGLVQARVNDERAYFMDGVAGHAGLFSSAIDIAKFAYLMLNEGTYAGVEYIRPETVRLFTTEQSTLSGRGLGFDRKSGSGFSTAGELAGKDTFGHLGFTGTSMWIDREKNMAVILLTNRTFPNRNYGKAISRIRAAVADATFRAITEYF